MILHGYKTLTDPDPGVTLIMPPGVQCHFNVPRWWYRPASGRSLVYEPCAKLDLGGGINLYISGEDNMNLNIEYRNSSFVIHDDDLNRNVDRVLATKNLRGVLLGTEKNYNDYEWDNATDSWKEHQFGSGVFI